MSPKLPQVGGERIVATLIKLGYRVIRQRGSHMNLRKKTEAGVHNITVPNHAVMAKGTLNAILTKVCLLNNIGKDELIKRL